MSVVCVMTNDSDRCDFALVGLYEVYDPEVGLNVVDLGLIYQLDFDEDAKKVHCLMTLTTQFCPMGDQITGDVTASLTEAFPDWQIAVELTFEPAWDYTKISDVGREFLGQ
ncbi:MAG: metal-sulfur cluster assembly factor [Crocinitomicaceae bacterium]|nr:metal-sulfur cluster assembly factor [Crocinitomicaceae bacterium]